MTNCIFYSMFFVLFLNISIGSLKYSQIHRTFMSIYKGMFEACAVTVDENGEPVNPYYNMDKMDNYINTYFKTNLSKYTKDYTVTYRYIGGTNTFICRSECRNITITLKAKINAFYDYEKTEMFSIKDGDTL